MQWLNRGETIVKTETVETITQRIVTVKDEDCAELRSDALLKT